MKTNLIEKVGANQMKGLLASTTLLYCWFYYATALGCSVSGFLARWQP
jgi:hypothetical protein